MKFEAVNYLHEIYRKYRYEMIHIQAIGDVAVALMKVESSKGSHLEFVTVYKVKDKLKHDVEKKYTLTQMVGS